MNHLDLFSGIGGFALAARVAGWTTLAFCEINPYCQRVLRKNFPGVPIHDDVRTYRADSIGPVDVLSGGFPCQPVSQIGKRAGTDDHRWLWPEMRRLVETIRPTWVVGENVVGIRDMELDQVRADLVALEYTVGLYDIPAASVGANHERRRIWIVAHSNCAGLQGQPGSGVPQRDPATGHYWTRHRWLPAPRICRAGDGISNRLDRLKGLGNAIVPAVAFEIFAAINAQSAPD